METVLNIARSSFSVDSIWSLVFRGAIWMVMCLLILAATDNPNPKESSANAKFYLGSFLLIIVVFTSLFYLLFSFAPA